jgi:hypothetical protein
MARIRIFVAAPSDVAVERKHVADVAASINRNIDDARDLLFQVVGSETDVGLALIRMGRRDRSMKICRLSSATSWSGSFGLALVRRCRNMGVRRARNMSFAGPLRRRSNRANQK